MAMENFKIYGISRVKAMYMYKAMCVTRKTTATKNKQITTTKQKKMQAAVTLADPETLKKSNVQAKAVLKLRKV